MHTFGSNDSKNGGFPLKRSLVIGNANVGKTMFCIRFARYLGVRQMRWFVEHTDGTTEQRSMPLEEAVRLLSSPEAHRTRELQTLVVQVPRGKQDRELMLTDSTGFADGVHPDPAIRASMGQTLRALFEAHLVLHIVDASKIGSELQGNQHDGQGQKGWRTVDEQLASYGLNKGGYLILANKMDLPNAQAGYQQLVKRFSKQRVVPVSALFGNGFREVKQHVWRYA